MEDNHNIEDFFNQSLEQFNDEPSDQVWAGIVERLDKKPPFYHFKIFWLMGLLWMLSLLGTGWFGLSQHEQVQHLQIVNEQLTIDNQLLSVNLTNCDLRYALTEQENTLLCNDLNNVSEKVTRTSTHRFNATVAKQPQQLPLFPVGMKDLFNKQPLVSLAEQGTLASAMLPNTVAEEAKNTTIRTQNKSYEKLKLLPLQPFIRKAYYTNFYRTGIDIISLRTPTPAKFRLPLRYGINAKVHNTRSKFFTDNRIDPATVNFSYGIAIYWMLNRDWAITSSVDVGVGTSVFNTRAIDRSVLATFPDIENIQNLVETIGIGSGGADFSLGLRYYINKPGKRRLYVESNLLWKLKVGPIFSYSLANQIDLNQVVEERATIGLGHLTAQIGLERSLSNKIHAEIGLFRQQAIKKDSYFRYGFNHFGLRTALLFGR